MPIKTLPPLEDIIDKEQKSGVKFVKLMQKLFKEDARIKGYRFKAVSFYRRLQIDGIVESGYPDVKGKVIFQFRRLKATYYNEGSTTPKLEGLLKQVVKSGIPFNRYILVTPFDLTPEQEGLLFNFRKESGMDLIHYGSAKIVEILEQYPALKKYLYREYKSETRWNFKELKQKYKEAVEGRVKNLRFVGLPTAQYQRPGLLKPVDLRDIYIPLNLIKVGDGKRESVSSQKLRIRKKPGRFLVLAGPGSGKTTLCNYLALDACEKYDYDDYPELEDKIPFIIPLCDFAWTQNKLQREFDFIDYLKYDAENRLLKVKDEHANRESHLNIDLDFFIAMLELGMAVAIFDGVDEIPNETWRRKIIKKIKEFADLYPDSSILVMSRLFVYKASSHHFNPRTFQEYHLQPIPDKQIETFIDKWYTLQIPEKIREDYRNTKIQSLKKSIKSSDYLGWFKRNPLYLTMMVILNQLAGGVPKNRALLYGKYLELILWTWPNRKYSVLGEENPLEKRGINYTEQLRLLCAVAAHIKQKDNTSPAASCGDNQKSNIITQQELKDVLFRERFDEIRLPEETAHEDSEVFFNYMVERTGFWVEKEENPEGEKIFSFIHSSFIEYLYAYHVTRDIEKTNEEHIDFLVNHLGYPVWEEFTLFALLNFSEIRLPDFFDLFCKIVFERIHTTEIPYAWVTLGRAVRDNIKFADEAVTRIIKELLTHWLKNLSDIRLAAREESIFYTVLKEIAEFSPRGKQFLRKGLEAVIIHNSTWEAFAALSFLKQFYTLDETILHTITNHKHREYLLPYLPIYRDETSLSTYIDENLKEKHWLIYYNSTRQQVLENLDRLAANRLSAYELKGYIISSWLKILEAFERRRGFFKKNKPFLGGKDPGTADFRFVTFGSVFKRENNISHPLLIFRDFFTKSHDISPPKIEDNYFVSLDRSGKMQVSGESQDYITYWAHNVLIQFFSAFKRLLPTAISFSEDEKQHIKKGSLNFGKQFSQDIVQYLNRSFRDDMDRCFGKEMNLQHPPNYITMDFRHYLGRYFKVEFAQIVNRREFNQVLRRKLNRDVIGGFSRYLARDLTTTLSEEITQGFLDSLLKDIACSAEDFKDYAKDRGCQDIKKSILDKYKSQHPKKEEEEWKESDYEFIYKLILNEFTSEKSRFIDSFYIYLYEYLFNELFETSFEAQDPDGPGYSADNIIRFPALRFSINNPFMIPFIFNFIFSVDLNHYMVKFLAHLNNSFYGKPVPDNNTFFDAVYDYYYDNPFITYFVNYSWDFFCKRFNDHHREDAPLGRLALADFLVNAAKVSLTVERPCDGNEWNRVLIKAEKSKDLFVQISLALYKLCNFIDPSLESGKIEGLLERFKHEYPDYYRLMGFGEKLTSMNDVTSPENRHV
jgi:hypothetical protein